MEKKILFCNCSYSNVIAEETRQEVRNFLESSGLEVVSVPDLCETAVHYSHELQELAREKTLKVIACYPRVVRWLFEAAGIPFAQADFYNMRTQSAAEIIGQLPSLEKSNSQLLAIERRGAWIPWFPVIDYDRCQNCQQCLSFCLFGVYELSDAGKVEVAHPQNCKTNCPACARICPDVAIIFPKYADPPINGGVIDDESLERQKVKVNLQKILGDDPYTALRERRQKSRVALLKKKNLTQALQERELCSQSLKNEESSA